MAEERIGDRLDAALRRLGVQREVRAVRLQQEFADVVGAALAPHCRAVSLDRGRLVVATAHGALAQQLQQESPQIIAALNGRLGAGAVRRLAFTAMERRAAGTTPDDSASS
ncbi:MAG: DUF721 domain-containing protein [Candidatus Dormibacteria bacterium]